MGFRLKMLYPYCVCCGEEFKYRNSVKHMLVTFFIFFLEELKREFLQELPLME
jgi:hypothetical protein